MDRKNTHKYIGNGAYYPGLPAQDLDAASLTKEQADLLVLGIEKGMYEVIRAEAPKKAKVNEAENTAKVLTEDTPIG